MSFTDLKLDPAILKAISACGYTTPTPIQAKAIPSILKGEDIVASAHTGSGKTAAFVLPALHQLSQLEPSKQTRILILTPTRELAGQITTAATQYGKFLRFNIVNLVGGMPYHQQIRELARGADIIVATPGRLMDHIEAKRVNLSNIQMLVLDEADRMLDMGFIDDVEYIAKLTPADRQTLLFSATVDKSLANVVRHLLKNPVRIDLSSEKLSIPQIDQQLYKANSPQHKTRLLNHFLREGNIFKAIIFSATKINADKIADRLCDDGFAAAALHGDLRQNVRNRTIEQLRRGKIQFLVATDVAARGIDISDVTHVINYDLPRFCEDYVHRIGRTGRAGKTGIAISFVLPTEMRNLQKIERFTGQRLKLISNIDVGQNETHERAPREREERAPREHASSRHEKPSFKKEYTRSNDRPFKKREDSGRDRPFKKRDDEHDVSPRFRAESRERPAFARSGERSERSERSERPAFARSSERGNRSDRPAFARGERSERGNRSERPAFARSSERGERTERSERPAFTHRTERSGSSDRPFKNRESSNDRPAFARGERSERPFKKREASSDRPAFARGDRPFKKREDSSSAADRPFKKRFDKDAPAGRRPFKSVAPSAGRKRADTQAAADPTLRKRISKKSAVA